MSSKQLLVGAAVATVLALASPAYAGLLGGAGSLGGGLGGNLGGNLGGSLNGVGGAGRLGGAGGLDSQGDLTGSVNKKPISKTAQRGLLSANAIPLLTPLKSAHTKNASVTPAECAVTKSLDLKSL